MTEGRSEHMTVYGLVGVAMFVVVGVLIVASYPAISSGWLATLVAAWTAAGAISGALWRRTVWIPLLASIGLSTIWMIVFFGSR